MTDIKSISNPLRELLVEKEIIARCELLLRIYQITSKANLSEEEHKELTEQVGKRIAPGIFASMMNKDPIFFDLPRLDTYTQMNGRIFHFLHTKRYSKQDFDNASSRFLRSIPELRSLLLQCMEKRLTEFMTEAGYALKERSDRSLTFVADKRTAKAFVVPSVRAINFDDCKVNPGEDCIVLVPSSESLEPFVQFFRDRGQEAEDLGIQIWIMNLEKSTIDPFIGYTTDLDIYNQFDNPRLSETVRNYWVQDRDQ
jgi:hypothetical protein